MSKQLVRLVGLSLGQVPSFVGFRSPAVAPIKRQLCFRLLYSSDVGHSVRRQVGP